MKYKTIKFRDVCKLVRGISYKSSDYTDENDENGEIFVNLKCVMPNGFRQDGIKYFNGSHKENQCVNNGDLLIANTDLTRNREVIGNSILVPEFNKKACFSMDLTKIEITDESILDRMYLYYYLKSPKARWFMINHSDGSTVVHLSTRSIPEMDLEIPDLETQQKIVRILSALDQKIELNNHLSTSLAEATQAILERFMKQYPYELQPLSSIANTIDCLHSKKPDSVPDSKYQLIQLDNIRDDGFLDMSSCRYYISPEDYKNWTKRCEITEGDCVITNVGRIGAISRAPRGTKAAMGRNMTCVRLKDKQALDSYFITVLLSKHMRRQIQKNTDEGTIMNALNVSNIPKLLFPVFSESNMKKIERLLSPIRKQIECRSLENQTLVQMQASILPKLMSGEINLNKVTLNE